MTKGKVRFGVLSTAKIGVQKVIPAMQMGEKCEVTAIASRDKTRALQAADEFQIPKAYGSYEVLLADADIDAVYIPLPNHLHVPWSVKCLQAGKHVLCEKPIGLTEQEARNLIKVAGSNISKTLAIMSTLRADFRQRLKQYDPDCCNRVSHL